MYLQYTKKLLDRLKIDDSKLARKDPGEDDLYSWHLNIMTIFRHKVVIASNDLTRYPIVLVSPNFKDLKNVFKDAIIEVFKMEGIKDEVIDKYLEKAGEIKFAKSGNRVGGSFIIHLL